MKILNFLDVVAISYWPQEFGGVISERRGILLITIGQNLISKDLSNFETRIVKIHMKKKLKLRIP